MLYAIGENQQKITPSPKITGYCPACQSKLVPKCGEINTWHWSHYRRPDCDSWYEPETEWHLGWKSLAPKENCEVILGPHRADIKGSRGIVIELQNSNISAETIRERENFYRNMIWIVNAQKFAERIRMNVGKFSWSYPHKSWLSAKMPVLFDFGDIEFQFTRKIPNPDYFPKCPFGDDTRICWSEYAIGKYYYCEKFEKCGVMTQIGYTYQQYSVKLLIEVKEFWWNFQENKYRIIDKEKLIEKYFL